MPFPTDQQHEAVRHIRETLVVVLTRYNHLGLAWPLIHSAAPPSTDALGLDGLQQSLGVGDASGGLQ